MTNQGDKQQSVRDVTGTSGSYNSDWEALFDVADISATLTFNERLLEYINLKLGSSYTNLPSAMQAFADDLGVYNWDSIGSFSAAVFSTESFTFLTADDVTSVGATNTKTGTVSTYRDSAGNWQLAALNEVRIHKSEDRDTMTMLIEPQSTNVCTNQKFNATATTNMTKGGDAASTLAAVSDATTTALIAASELQDIITNDTLFVLDNSAGVAEAYVDIAGATGSTNPTSLSVFAAVDSAGNNARFALYDSVGTAENAVRTNITGTALARYKQKGTTPDAATDNMRLTVAAGRILYFIANQTEVYHTCTSPIYSTSAAAVTRNRDDISAVYSYASETGGFMVKFYMPDIGGTTQGIFSLTDSAGGSANSVGMRSLSPRPMLEAQIQTNSGDDSLNDISGIIPSRANWCSIYWDETNGTSVAPNLRFNRVARDAFSADLTEMWFGKDRQFGSHGFVEIDELVIVTNGTPTLNDVADVVIPDDAICVVCSMAQSNTRVFGRDETSGSNRNDGEIAIIEELSAYYPSNTCFWLDASSSGSSMYQDGASPNRWYDFDPAGNDVLLDNALEMMTAFSRKGRILCVVSGIGETDQGSLTKEEWKTTKTTIKGVHDTAGFDVPWILIGAGSRTVAADSGYNIWREGDREIAEENADIYLGVPTVDLDMDPASSNLHISSQGTVDYAPKMAAMAASLDGVDIGGIAAFSPVVTYIERDGTDIYMSHEYDGNATDFTPTTAIQGAVFLDDGAEQTISAHVRENAFTSKITLAGAPSGVEELWYGYGTLDDVSDFTKVIKDNSTNALMLQLFNENLPFARYDFDNFADLLIWHDSNVSTTVSQRTDLSGNSRHATQGTAGSQPTINSASQFNKDSLKFDATNDTMTIVSDATLAALSDELTLEFIIKGTPSAGFKVLFRNDFGGTGWIIQNDSNGGNGSTDNRLFAKVTTDAGATTFTNRIETVFDGNIHHCIFRLDNGTGDFFLDGVKTNMGSYSVGSNGFASSSNWQIHGGDNLDDWLFATYGQALTDTECAQKWEHAKARWQIT